MQDVAGDVGTRTGGLENVALQSGANKFEAARHMDLVACMKPVTEHPLACAVERQVRIAFLGRCGKRGAFVPMPYRTSKYIDFDAGTVTIAPMQLAAQKPSPLTLDDKIDLFECRVEVWLLGTAVATLTAIESHQPPSIWSHAAYGLLSCATSYFEMIGKTLNPNSKTSGTAGIDFNYGFCDVYPSFVAVNGSYHDKDIPHVKQFRDRLRNGLYHLAFTKQHLWIHNNLALTTDDFHITTCSPPGYCVNPHRLIRSLVDHFPSFIFRIRDPNNFHLRGGFKEFFDEYYK